MQDDIAGMETGEEFGEERLLIPTRTAKWGARRRWCNR